MSANSHGAFAFLRSRATSDAASICSTLRIEYASWMLLYLYFDTILRWATLIYAPHVCCAVHYVFLKNYDRTKVAVYAHAVTQRFFSHL